MCGSKLTKNNLSYWVFNAIRDKNERKSNSIFIIKLLVANITVSKSQLYLFIWTLKSISDNFINPV